MIVWNESFSVKVKRIDKQHQHFIRLMNQLDQAINNRDFIKEIDRGVEALASYAWNHFTIEEDYFDQFNYAGAAEHKEEHRKLKLQLARFLAKKEQPEIDIYQFYYDLLEFLADWLEKHMKEVDQKYSQCFNEHGLS